MDGEDKGMDKPELELMGACLQMSGAANAKVGDAFQLTATAIVCCITEEMGDDGIPAKTVEFSLNALNLSDPLGSSPEQAATALYKGE